MSYFTTVEDPLELTYIVSTPVFRLFTVVLSFSLLTDPGMAVALTPKPARLSTDSRLVITQAFAPRAWWMHQRSEWFSPQALPGLHFATSRPARPHRPHVELADPKDIAHTREAVRHLKEKSISNKAIVASTRTRTKGPVSEYNIWALVSGEIRMGKELIQRMMQGVQRIERFLSRTRPNLSSRQLNTRLRRYFKDLPKQPLVFLPLLLAPFLLTGWFGTEAGVVMGSLPWLGPRRRLTTSVPPVFIDYAREIKLLGIPIFSDSRVEAQFLYKGEPRSLAFRFGREEIRGVIYGGTLYDGSRQVGNMTFGISRTNTVYIDHIFIDPDERQQGYSTLAMALIKICAIHEGWSGHLIQAEFKKDTESTLGNARAFTRLFAPHDAQPPQDHFFRDEFISYVRRVDAPTHPSRKPVQLGTPDERHTPLGWEDIEEDNLLSPWELRVGWRARALRSNTLLNTLFVPPLRMPVTRTRLAVGSTAIEVVRYSSPSDIVLSADAYPYREFDAQSRTIAEHHVIREALRAIPGTVLTDDGNLKQGPHTFWFKDYSIRIHGASTIIVPETFIDPGGTYRRPFAGGQAVGFQLANGALVLLLSDAVPAIYHKLVKRIPYMAAVIRAPQSWISMPSGMPSERMARRRTSHIDLTINAIPRQAVQDNHPVILAHEEYLYRFKVRAGEYWSHLVTNGDIRIVTADPAEEQLNLSNFIVTPDHHILMNHAPLTYQRLLDAGVKPDHLHMLPEAVEDLHYYGGSLGCSIGVSLRQERKRPVVKLLRAA